MLLGNKLHILHCKEILVNRHIGGCVYGSKLVLRGRRLVVLGLCVYTECPERLVKVRHKCAYSRLERSEIVILKLLSLGSRRAEKGSSRKLKVLSLIKERLVYYKIFLLCSNGGRKSLGGGVAEKAKQSYSLGAYCVHRTKQGGLCIKGISRIGAECRGYVERAVLYERVRAGIPSRISSRLKGSAKSARGERGRIGFSLNKLLSRKLHNDLAGPYGSNKGVVLFGGYARKGLEPVGIVGSAFFYCPVLHCVCHNVCNRRVYGLTRSNGFCQGFIDLLGKPLTHDLVVEHHASEYFRNSFFHVVYLLYFRKSTDSIIYPYLYIVKYYCAFCSSLAVLSP